MSSSRESSTGAVSFRAPSSSRLSRRYGIRTVVNFQLPGREMEAERTLAGKLGIGFVNLPMPGDGFGEEAQFRKVLEVIDDPQRQPVLVHCARGTCRTGSAVALYRFERDGWTIQDVAAELRRRLIAMGSFPATSMPWSRPSLRWCCTSR